jgi:hypothetical protein
MAQGAIARGGTPPRWGDQIAALSDERLNALGQAERLGSELNFLDAVPALRVIREVLTALSYQDPVWEPRELAGEVSQHLDELMRDVDLIEAFTPSDNPAQRRANVLQTIDNQRSWFVSRVAPVLRSADVAGANALTEALAKRDEIIAAAEEARAALVTIREASGEKGTADLARYFEDQAKVHAIAADNALRAAVIAVTALLVAGAALVFIPELAIKPTSDWVEYARQLLPRLFLLGIIAYAVRFAVRNFTVNKHLQVSNEQRANILRTFPLMIASGQTEVQKDRMAVLLTQAAVSTIDSGYLKHPEDKGLDSSALAAVELLRR